MNDNFRYIVFFYNLNVRVLKSFIGELVVFFMNIFIECDELCCKSEFLKE